MIILFWFLIRIIFVLSLLCLIYLLIKETVGHEAFKIFKNGLIDGFKGSGFLSPKSTYRVELYKWVTMNDEDVCEDCLERSNWPPMDIADWMKEGLPGTPEAETACQHQHKCRCQLVLYKKITLPKKS